MVDFEKYGYIAPIVLFLWFPFVIYLFSSRKVVKAAAQSVIWGMMFLPEAVELDLPVLPPLNKYHLTAIAVLLCIKWKAPERIRAARFGRGYDWFILIAIFAAIFITTSYNDDRLVYGTYKVSVIEPFLKYDSVVFSFGVFFSIMVPYWIGRATIRSSQDMIVFLRVFVTGAMVYTIPILWELKMSPRLHADLYGYASRSDWFQNIRAGGWRPTVFMGHGLVVAFFMCIAFVSSLLLKRLGLKRMLGMPMWLVTAVLFVFLILCKSSGPLAYALFAWLVLKLKPRKQFWLVAFLASLVLSYPVTRMTDFFPTKLILETAETIFGKDRMESQQFRFDNEDMLLTKGSEKFFFGWGGFGRDRVYAAEDGRDMTVQDGWWIMIFGQQGFVGFICIFAVLLLPLFRLKKKTRKFARFDKHLIAGVALIAGLCAVNTLPNMSFPNIHMIFVAGLSVLLKTTKKSCVIAAKTSTVKV